MPDYTTTALLTSINNRGLIPTGQTTFQDSDILALASEEMRSYVVPLIMKVRSEYFTFSPPDVALEANVASYEIPSRAVGGKLRALQLVDSTGNVYDIPMIQDEDVPFYNGYNDCSTDYVFRIQGNSVVVLPTPQLPPGASLRFTIYFRPNELVASSDAAQITAIDTNTKQVTVSATPSTFSTSTPLDFIKGSPGFECRGYDHTPTDVTGNIITFSELPTGLTTTDWLALSGQSPIAQIPYDLHPLLAQTTVAKMLEAQGDAANLQACLARLKQMEDNALHLLSPRTDGNPKKLINRYSPLRAWGRF